LTTICSGFEAQIEQKFGQKSAIFEPKKKAEI